MKKVLDHGHLRRIETWGSDEHIVEAARQSTGKGIAEAFPRTWTLYLEGLEKKEALPR